VPDGERRPRVVPDEDVLDRRGCRAAAPQELAYGFGEVREAPFEGILRWRREDAGLDELDPGTGDVDQAVADDAGARVEAEDADGVVQRSFLSTKMRSASSNFSGSSTKGRRVDFLSLTTMLLG
jgi:hypothetical protein